jgi:hypothetical protein
MGSVRHLVVLVVLVVHPLVVPVVLAILVVKS